MERANRVSIYLLVCLLLCAFMIIYIVLVFDVDDASLKKGKLHEFPVEWENDISKQNHEYIVTMKNVVPEMEAMEMALYVKTYHQIVQIFVGDECIYEYGTNVAVTFGNSVPSAINILPMDASYAGKTITIYLASAYKKNGKVVPEVLIGNERMIIYKIVKEHSFLIIETIAMFVISIALIVFWINSKKTVYANRSFLYLGLSVFMLTTWFATNSQLLGLIFGNVTVIMYICYMSFFLIPIPVLLYFEEEIGQGYQKFFHILEYISLGYFFSAYALQFLNILNFKQLLYGVHLIFAMCLILFLYILIDRHRKGTGQRNYKRLTGYCVAFCLVMMLVDALRYYFYYGNDVAAYTRLGLIAYVLGLSIGMLQDSFNSLALAKEAAIYEKLAFFDKLTGLLNRTAYENMIKDYDEQIQRAGAISGGLIVVCFDLNHLKKINDSQGHLQGDSYIKLFSSMLLDVFREFGSAYRTGGDEFVVILNDISENQTMGLIHKLQNAILCYNADHHRQWEEVELSTAYGVAVYDPLKDKRVQNVIERADQLMYRNKAMQKNKNKSKEKMSKA